MDPLLFPRFCCFGDISKTFFRMPFDLYKQTIGSPVASTSDRTNVLVIIGSLKNWMTLFLSVFLLWEPVQCIVEESAHPEKKWEHKSAHLAHNLWIPRIIN